MKLIRGDCSDLVDDIAEVIEEYMETHPETQIDEIAATVSYVHGCLFRLARDVPASKLH